MDIEEKTTNYKPEIREFGILAIKIISELLKRNIRPTNKYIIELISYKMDVHNISKLTRNTYCAYARRIVKNGTQIDIDNVLSGKISIGQLYSIIQKKYL